MKKSLITFSFFALVTFITSAQTPTFEKFYPSDVSLQPTGFANDGSRVVVKDTVLSNPTTIGKILRKINADGSFNWSILFKGNSITAGITGNQIIIDETGNIYLMGRVKGTVYYKTDSVKSNFTNAANVFVAKLSSSGAMLWKWQSVHDNTSFAADDEAFKGILKGGNLYVSGNSKGRSISFGSFSFPQAQYNSMNKVFVLKFDTDGTIKWASMAKNGNLTIRSIDADASGNVYIGGQTSGGGTLDFGNSITMAVTENSHFVAKYNSNGEAQLAKVVVTGRNSSDCKSASVDDAGNMYISGYNDWPSSVNGITMRSAVSYIIKLDNTGAFQWKRTLTAPLKTEGVQSTKFVNGRMYFIAKPAPSGNSYVQSGATDSIKKSNKGVIVGAYTPDGILEWNDQGIATNATAISSSANIIEVSQDNAAIYIGGTFIVDEKFGTLTIPAPGAVGAYQNAYIKLKVGAGSGSVVQFNNQGFKAYPNPAQSHITIELVNPESEGTIKLIDMQGKKVLEKQITSNQMLINLEGIPKGIYVLVSTSKTSTFTRKISIE